MDSSSDDIELARYVEELDLDRIEPRGSPNQPTSFKLTEDGRTVAKWLWGALPDGLRDDLVSLERQYGRLPLRELLRLVYERYPEMTTRSEIKGQLGIQE